MGIEGGPQNYLGNYRPGVFDRLLPLFTAAAEHLPPPNKASTIIDMGCGIGMFAEVVFNVGYTKYLGIDFSPTVITLSKKRVPEAEFIVGNLKDKEIHKLIENYKIFVLLEVLEHIEADLDIIAAIPSNSLVIFSVPSFDDPFHVRHFNSVNSVIKRYESLIKFNKSKTIDHRFLFSCIRY